MGIAKHTGIGSIVATLTSSGLAIADCPKTMPEQLFEDCIVYEGAGSSFPPSDYAYMDEYVSWMDTQKPPETALSGSKQTTVAAPNTESSVVVQI